MTKALTKTENIATMRDLLEKNKTKIAEALSGTGMDMQRYMRIIFNAINASPRLQICSAKSVVLSVLEASQLGLELNSQLGHAYLIPWKGKDGYYASYLIGYKGILHLIYNSGKVSSVRAVPVFAWDKYTYKEGTETTIIHEPQEPPKDRTIKDSDLVAVYSIAKIAGRDADFVWMWKSEVDAIRARSKAKDSGPWVTDYIEMAKKTVIRKHGKTLPMSPKDQLALSREEGRELGYIHPMDTSDVPELIEPESDGLEEIPGDENGEEKPKPVVAELKERLAKATLGTGAPATPAATSEPKTIAGVEYAAPGVALINGKATYAPEKWPDDLPAADGTPFREFALMWKKERLVEWESTYRHLVKNLYGSIFPLRHLAGFFTLWQQKMKADYWADGQPGAIKNAEAQAEKVKELPDHPATPEGAKRDVMAADFEIYKSELEAADIAALLESFGVDSFDSLNDADKAAFLQNCQAMLDKKAE